MAGSAKAQWLGMRVLYEQAGATFEMLAAATSRSAQRIAARAKKEGWVPPDHAAGLPARGARLNALVDHMIDEIEAIGDDPASRWDKDRIDAVSALMRTLEKIGEITRNGESAKENQTKRDADIADVLRRIDRRIVELATGFAEQLVAAKPQHG